MKIQNRNAFTMMELIFVIVIIGILSAVAVPKFAATRDDALIAKTKSTIAAIQNAVATERQKRILKGDFSLFTSLGGTTGYDVDLFDYFDGDTSSGRILQTPVTSCKNSSEIGCWMKINDTTYVYKMPLKGGEDVTFTFDGKSSFSCDATISGDPGRFCKMLTR